jgi:hypothetical protein
VVILYNSHLCVCVCVCVRGWVRVFLFVPIPQINM